MISMDKKYRTRDGREVRTYATDGKQGREIHGAVLNFDGQWDAVTWMLDGCFQPFTENSFDLIEVKPRIQRTVWLNVYEKSTSIWGSKEHADARADRASFDRIACVKIEIDCEEGEGL